MLTLLLAAALAQNPAPPSSTDTPSAVRLLFQAGDLRRAIGMAKACAGSKKKGFKECAVFVKPLVEYQSLIGQEKLTATDARALLEAEHLISPDVPSRLSAEAVGRYITHPYEQAVAAQRGGDEALAQSLAKQILEVSPHHEGALAILGVSDGGVRDAGSIDAGHARPRSRDAGR